MTAAAVLREAGRARMHDDARREFFMANYARLAGWVRRQVDDDETAHDIAAEAFTRLLSRWSDLDDPHAYLYKVAVNLLRDHWRRSLRERRVLSLAAADQRDGPDRRPERADDLRAMLEPLPELRPWWSPASQASPTGLPADPAR